MQQKSFGSTLYRDANSVATTSEVEAFKKIAGNPLKLKEI